MMSLKRRKPNVTFSWYKSFAILAPWRKGKGDMVIESEVVLTKMKLFNNFQEKFLNAEDSISTMSMSVSEPDITSSLQAKEAISDCSAAHEANMEELKKDYVSAIFSDSQFSHLYKFESEDSGVEMPSGANSPSTPTGSEQSFVVHSRESSCDSGNLNSSIHARSTLLLLEPYADIIETEETSRIYAQQGDLAVSVETDVDNVMLKVGGESERLEVEALGNISECFEEVSECVDAVDMRAVSETVEDPGSRCCNTEVYDDNTGKELQQKPLTKNTRSNSLDEYMEECCRLSEVNQAHTNPLGSGLGYLEHICQLIEKIGQLQEHNLKLQKQICGLQKDTKVTKTKEDFFLQHCHCGAAGLAFPELKKHSRIEHHSLIASTDTLSDLNTIPECTHISLRPSLRDGDGGCQTIIPVWRRGLSRRSYTEGEAKYLSDIAEVLSAPHRRLENYTWGRMKELVKKTRMRNQSRLGLSSNTLKRSCPQLYQPELGPEQLSRRERNSMIVLGHQKLEYHWA